jgi:dTDP-4-amino-4,6-dideoxygalactose transaminase
VLRVKLRYLDDWTGVRQRNADAYRACLSKMNVLVVAPKPVDSGNRHVYNQFVVCAEQRDQLQAYLKANGIGTEVYYPLPLHLQGRFAQLGYKKGDFPVSEKLAGAALTLPVSADVAGER